MGLVENKTFTSLCELAETRPRTCLKDLAQKQIEEDQKKRLEGPSGIPIQGKGNEVLKWYEKTQVFKEVRAQQQRFLSGEFNMDDPHPLFLNYYLNRAGFEDFCTSRFSGRMFRDIAHELHRARLAKYAKHLILLSPPRTLKFYKEVLYPKAIPTGEFPGLESLTRVTVPNSLVLKRKENRYSILEVGKYTLLDLSKPENREKIEGQCASLYQDREDYPDVFCEEGFGIVLITPQRAIPFSLEVPSDIKLRRYNTPFSSKQFGWFVDRVTDSCHS